LLNPQIVRQSRTPPVDRMRTLAVAIVVALVSGSCAAPTAGTATPVSPTAVAPPAANYAGTWDLTVLMTSCDSPWARYMCGRPPTLPSHRTLRLAQLGAHVAGLLNGMDVTGDVDGAGVLTLSGQGIIAEYGGTTTLTSFEARQSAGTGLEGRIGMESWIPLHFEPLGGTHKTTDTILSAARSALPSTFSGVGNFQERGCTTARCAGPAQEFSLRLRDDGGQLTGTLDLRLNQHGLVAGRASDNTAELLSLSDSSASTLGPFVVTDMRIARSATGRLTGTLHVEYRLGPPQDLELVDVTLLGSQ
jgi:hypothetical protein